MFIQAALGGSGLLGTPGRNIAPRGASVARASRLQRRRFDPPLTIQEDVVDEIIDMVKPKERAAITLKDLVDCKVGETVVGILTDVFAFLQYDQREQLMHSAEE